MCLPVPQEKMHPRCHTDDATAYTNTPPPDRHLHLLPLWISPKALDNRRGEASADRDSDGANGLEIQRERRGTSAGTHSPGLFECSIYITWYVVGGTVVSGTKNVIHRENAQMVLVHILQCMEHTLRGTWTLINRTTGSPGEGVNSAGGVSRVLC